MRGLPRSDRNPYDRCMSIEPPAANMPSLDQVRLVLFSKFPTPGAVKTRLIPELGAVGAAALHRKLAKRCFDVISRSAQAVNAICEVRFSGADEADFQNWLGDEAVYVRQSGGDLGARLQAAMAPSPSIFFGADTPDLTEKIVLEAIDRLAHADVVIGPAMDGGYYLIGARRNLPFLFEEMPWSTARLLNETIRRLTENNIDPHVLEPLRDCDRPDDLAAWPWLLK